MVQLPRFKAPTRQRLVKRINRTSRRTLQILFSTPSCMKANISNRITTVWDCALYGTPATSASCLVTSTSPGHSFPGTSTSIYPSASGDAFPTYEVVITSQAATTVTQASESGSRAQLFSGLIIGSGIWGVASTTGSCKEL